MPNIYPYSNFHELNLDWMLEEMQAQRSKMESLEQAHVPYTETPAMDVEGGSPGTSEEYARGDHQHPTDTSRASVADLENLEARLDQISQGAEPSTSNPLMDGVASPGTSGLYARGDHRHPTDTSRASAADVTALQTLTNNRPTPAAATSAPVMDGTAAVGSSALYAREDHVHPTDTSRASATALNTLDVKVDDLEDNLQTQLNTLSAKVAFSTEAPLMDGTASAGASAYQARSDHRHPTDTSRASASDLAALTARVDAMSGGTGGGGSAADPATNDPLMDGTATPGTSTSYARGDHRHPTDTSRASAADVTALQNLTNNRPTPAAATSAPVMDGTAAVGSSTLYARADHRHPTDTSRASAAALTALQTQVNELPAPPTAATATPLMDGTASAGSAATYARGDHKHPSDTTRASAADLNALRQQVENIATPPSPTETTPLMDGSASIGTETAYARGDHRHPTDTSRASAADLTTLQNQVNNLNIPAAGTGYPVMDGAASAGTGSAYARSDHRHPTDTSRASAADLTALQQQVNNLSGVTPSDAAPVMDGTAAAGSSALYARGDHVHPTDTSRASAAALNTLSQAMASKSNALVVETLDFGDISINANAAHRATIDAYKAGYTFLGFLGYMITNAATNGRGASTCHVYEMTYTTNDEAQLVLAHYSTSSVNIHLSAKALYVANS